MMGLTFLIILAGIIGGLVLKTIELTIISAIFGLVWIIFMAIMFCCYRSQFEAAIVLLKVTGQFLRSKPSVLLAPLIVMFISFFYFAFWVVSFIGIQVNRPPETFTDTNQQHTFTYHDLLTAIWLFLNLFYSYFLYYVMVFLIATATAMWYFNIEGNFITKGFKNLWNGHIGSLTFASIIVALISFMKSSSNNNNQNSAASCCICIMKCCFSMIE